MPPLQGYAVTPAVDAEIVAAYAASNQKIPGVVTGPGWTAIGTFYLPKTVQCLLDVIALTTDPALAFSARLYDPVTGVPVSGSVASAASMTAVDTRLLSGVITLQGNKIWGLEAQAVGATGDGEYAVVRTAGLVSP